MTALTTSPDRNVAFQVGSVSVEVGTYLPIEFMMSLPLDGSLPIAGHAWLMPSYVTRPISSASAHCMAAPWKAPTASSKYGCVQAGFSKTPSSVRYSTATMRPMSIPLPRNQPMG